ncbi:glycosyltransferase [[Clostridium] hylemonae]|nr:glycosyltransferase [[Clostridium] hylemonae]QEK17154.1 hypothetical protein LAJLEIBI_01163 [[Clostridium] hylemonae DSM 15053]
MMAAFDRIGYDVDVVMGYGKERKASINAIKKKINKGIKYDFLYSESSTMPTLLTEKNHLPLYPFLDFGFFKFCKKHNIKIALFYRDIHWKFGQYKAKVPLYQRMVTIPMYRYDLFQYQKYLDIIYLPTLNMGKYVNGLGNVSKVDTLPPGADKRIVDDKSENYNTSDSTINIFYVGGVLGIYNFEKLLKIAKQKSYVRLKLCCRENEWNMAKHKYSDYLTERVDIVHKHGKELEQYYAWADLCSCYFEPSLYMEMAVPIKLLEYVSFQVPIIATKGTAAGNFVEKYGCGFSIPYDEGKLENVLETIHEDKRLLLNKYKQIKDCINENTWESRAQKVAGDLTSIEGR